MTIKYVFTVNADEKSDEKEGISREWPQVLAILSASLSALTCGLLFSWTSPTIPILISSDFPGNITLEQASYLTVLSPLAWALASPIFSYLSDVFGRKNSLLFVTIPHLIAWALVAFSESIWLLYLSRLMDGIGDACVFGVLPMYMGEVATPKVRGVWGNALSVMIFLGQFVINLVGSFFSIQTTAFILAGIPVLFAVTFAYMPESPYYLVMRGRTDDAERALRWLRHKDDVTAELRQLQTDVGRQLSEPGTFRDLFTIESNRRALLIGAIARLCQQFAGIAAFATYTKYLFQQAGGIVSTTMSVVMFSGAVMVGSTCASGVLDRLGRKKSMIVSCLGCAVTLFLLATFLYVKQYDLVDVSAVSWFPIAGMLAFVAMFSIGLAIVPNILLGELFSSSIKGKALCMMNICFAVCVGGVSKMFQLLLSAFGMWVPFAMFCVCCIAGSVVSHYMIVETTGKTLEEIQQELKGNRSRAVKKGDCTEHLSKV